MLKIFSRTIFLLLIFFLFSDLQAAEIDYEYRGDCPIPAGGRYSNDDIDRWLFYKCECTSYASAMLTKADAQINGNSFQNIMSSSGCNGTNCLPDRWSHAKYWAEKARSLELNVDNTPAIGAVAWWGSAKWNDYYGHVAYVDFVLDDGRAVISEYNYSPSFNFGIRTVNAEAYIHFNLTSPPIIIHRSRPNPPILHYVK